MAISKAKHKFKKLCLSFQGEKALLRLQEEKLSSHETISSLAPKNAVKIIGHGGVWGCRITRESRAQFEKDAAALAKSFCLLLSRLPESAANPGLIPMLKCAGAFSFWSACLLSKEGVLARASLEDVQAALRGIKAVSPKSMSARAWAPQELLVTERGVGALSPGARAWQSGARAERGLEEFWAPHAALASAVEICSLAREAMKGGRYHNALALLASRLESRPLRAQEAAGLLSVWSETPVGARFANTEAREKSESEWEALAVALFPLCSDARVGDAALARSINVMSSRGASGLNEEERERRLGVALRIGALLGWSFPLLEQWPERSLFSTLRSDKETRHAEWAKSRARYERMALELVGLPAEARAPRRSI